MYAFHCKHQLLGGYVDLFHNFFLFLWLWFSCSPLRVKKLHLDSLLLFCVMDGAGHNREN